MDKYFDLQEIAQDVVKRSFITAGFVSLLLMLPLAVTSTNRWIQRLGAKRWQQLHRLVYVAAVASLVHYYWLVQSDIRWPLFYAVSLALLLVSRLLGPRSTDAKSATSLKLLAITRQTGDTVKLRVQLPAGKPLGAKAWQFLTFDWMVDGRRLPRSYSLSSSPFRTDFIEITVKQQGVVSTYVNHEAKEGLTVEAHGPFGQFCFDEKKHRRIVLLAGGSGVTPILSILRNIEEIAPDVEIVLMYAVRTERDVIFQDELARLKERLSRFRAIVSASRPGPEWAGLCGHVDRGLIEQEAGAIRDQTFFVCGPPGFMAGVEEIMMSLGGRSEQIRRERFTVGAPVPTTGQVLTHPVEFARSMSASPVSRCSASQSAIASKSSRSAASGNAARARRECLQAKLRWKLMTDWSPSYSPRVTVCCASGGRGTPFTWTHRSIETSQIGESTMTPKQLIIAPPFTPESAIQKVQMAEDAWNSKDPERVALAYSVDSEWRNRTEFVRGREEIKALLRRKWAKELDYRLKKTLWGFREKRIAVSFEYEWHDAEGRWYRSYGNELWEFDAEGLMRRRLASINDAPIEFNERRVL